MTARRWSLAKAYAAPLCALGLVVLASCGGDHAPTQPQGTSIADYISQVAAADGQVRATVQQGTLPQQGSGPAVRVQQSGAVILGGTSIFSLSAGSTFSRVVVAIDGVPGYYDVMLPSGATGATLLLTLAQQLPNTAFTIRVGAADAAGAIGAYATTPVAIRQVGTGDVQVSVSWDAPSDVDLHVVDPSGQDVYYSNPGPTAAGGTLDLDSNAGCSIDGVNNENITWPASRAPRGTYTVRVDYWAGCDVPATKYVVTVRVKGQAPRTFAGTFTGGGDNGDAGSGRTITTFTY